ncbi:MAG: hypothetical protein HETSPECPRED_005993 [Heterodermia speciosa]|uniref:Uncharacterized protein n=1 Tax=Heterodermia speciosa TaxID=116794 RepID=A0A8H3EHS9_9LECA|nr:MAG: hypothetical protein HETSPECPRED_005993 [Heterodermia speciosa]
MRYAVDTCAFDFPQANNKTMSYSCQNACVKLSTSLETNIQNPSNSTPYDYCQDETFVPNIDSCASCYAVHPDQVYLSNFLKTLKSACITQPSNTKEFIVKPSQVFTLNPPSEFPTSTTQSRPSHELPHGAVVAIGICVPVFFFLVLSLVFLYCYLRIQNRHSHNKRPKRHRRWNQKSAVEPHHGWHQDSTAQIRPVSYVPPPRTRYSNPLAQIVENPEQPSDQSDQSDPGGEDLEKDPEKRTKHSSASSRPRPPSGLVSWERRGVEDATVKNIRFSDSMNSTHNSTLQTSASTTIIPSDGRRDSGESIDEEAERRNRDRQELTPPPLFSIPESGSSTTFVPARSGSAWDNNPSSRDERSTSRLSRRSESLSRTSRRSEEAQRSLSRTSRRSEEAANRPPISPRTEEATRSMSRGEREPPRSHSRRSDRQSSIETRLEEASREPPQSPRGEGLNLFRDISYEPKPND